MQPQQWENSARPSRAALERALLGLPTMRAHLLYRDNEHRRSFLLAFDKGEDPLPLLADFARREQLRGSQLTLLRDFCRGGSARSCRSESFVSHFVVPFFTHRRFAHFHVMP
jgi:hypothetical protein